MTNNAELAEKMRVLRLHGGKPKYFHSMVGGNFRLDAIQAAVLLIKFRYLDDWTRGRQSNASVYDRLFSDFGANVLPPVKRPNVRHIYNQYTITANDRDGLQEHLKSRGIGTEVYYPVPLHLQVCFASLGYKVGDCPRAEAAAKSVLSIPIYPELSQDRLGYVADCCVEFFQT